VVRAFASIEMTRVNCPRSISRLWSRNCEARTALLSVFNNGKSDDLAEGRFPTDFLPTAIDGIRPKVRFAQDSPLEGDGFEPSVPRQKDNAFRASSFPT
jgi:hypothetical protein